MGPPTNRRLRFDSPGHEHERGRGLNAAIRRLREALGDSADTPKYIETLPRRG